MEVLARTASALAGAELDRAWDEALRQLAALQLSAAAKGDDVWLRVTHASRSLELQAHAARPSASFRAALCALLELALLRAEERDARQRAQERADLLSGASFEGLLFHVDGVVFDVNQRLAELLGYPAKELIGETTMERCVAPEDLAGVLARLATSYEGAYVITGVRKDGSRFRAELQAKQGKLGDRPVRVAAVRDVTERERTQMQLQEAEARMRSLVEATFDVTAFSRDGVIVEMAGATEAVLGYSPERMIGRNIVDFVSPGTVSIVAGKLTEPGASFYLAEAVTPHGELVPVEIVAIMSTLDGAPVRVSAMRDLRATKRLENERAKLQRDLERSQRLDSLGVLAGGIAHDFNNLLMGVIGYAELLRERLRSSEDLELLQGVLDAGQRAASLTEQLLAYAGRKELGPRVAIDLSALLHELRVLMDATLSKKALVLLEIEPACVVLGNRATLTQVAMNLLTNASDALQNDRGQVTVRLRRAARPDARFTEQASVISESGWVLLEVSDTGCGMDDATQARIFEPFFSTKPQGHGLGLAACLGIVSSQNGSIHVESTPGLGSTFAVLLPAHAAEPTVLTRSAPPRQAANLRVLVVDDEPLIRSQLQHALSQRGYSVELAEGGERALQLLAGAGAQPFALVILDMTMPDLSGVEVLRRIRSTGTRMPVVLSSGYHDAALDLEPNSYQGFLIKPYTLSQLFDTVQAALDTVS